MRCLFELGADPMSYKLEPRTGSCRKGPGDLSIEVVKLLVEFGYDVKSTGHLILEDFVDSQESLDWLLDQGVDINRTRNDATLALTGGKRGYGSYNLRQRQYSVVVLNYVAARGDIRLFDHLVSRGADPQRSLALHYATRCLETEKSVAMIDHLLDHYGMDIHADNEKMRDRSNSADDSGKPLNSAVVAGNLPAIRRLLERGARPDYTAVACAIECAYFKDLPAGLNALLKAGADAGDALEQAAQKENVDAVRIRLAYGADRDRSLQQNRAYFENKARDLVPNDHSEGVL
ncbi:hypothetical protein WHR41_05945 [Cladosporium halotolerans]|uniref:Ankyrin repeat protein n=1 Tax=Cladosporium halotolerans TaxID=1052096 RepID=A0AB34KPI8_9PEZI